MPDVKQIMPLSGSNIMLERSGRVLLDVDEISIGLAGVTGVIGHNGAGKSLLLKVLTGLVPPDQGEVLWQGKSPSRELYPLLGYMKQTTILLRRSVRANLEYPLRLAGVNPTRIAQSVREAIRKHGLEAVADSSARVLSGGEKQRVALARTLISEPQLIILDEPTANLDPVSTASIETFIASFMLKNQTKDEKNLILVTHDLAQAKRLCDRIIYLDNGRILHQQTARKFFQNPGSKQARKFLGLDL